MSVKTIVERARKCEEEIVQGARTVRSALVYLAPRILECQENRYWEALGYESMNAFLASPDIEIAPSYAKALAYTYRDLVVERGVDIDELEGVDLRKVQYALPAVKAGEVDAGKAIADAKTLTRNDMAELYRRGATKGLSADDEPERVKCPTCGGWTVKA